MSKKKDIHISKLLLNTKNPRTMECTSQQECLSEIYHCGPSSFETLIKSILQQGFLQGENILVKPAPHAPGKYIVEEGNRRISALKLLHGQKDLLKAKGIPDALRNAYKKLSAEKKEASTKIPCLIFSDEEKKDLLAEIAVRHMSSSAPRDSWPSVQKARFARDYYDSNSPELELLERYFEGHQGIGDRWAPVFPLTYLKDFLSKLPAHLGYKDAWQVARTYPDPATKDIIDKLIEDIMNKGVPGIEILANRRTNASAFLSENYPPSGIQPSKAEQPSPIKKEKAAVDVQLPPAPTKRLPHPISPIKNHAKEIRALSARIPNSKLQQLAKENYQLVDDKLDIPFAKSVILRTLLDSSIQLLCRAYGKSPTGSKPMLGQYIDCVLNNNLVSDPRTKGLLVQVKNKNLESLNVVVHGADFSPAPSDLEDNYANVLPLIKTILEEVIKRQQPSSTQGI